ncbi:type II toxin-antitoxin system RelE/ParE family toxin [Bacteroides gallinarum]|uniref:type II toxin-antitoxin system RelE/ParE family toxin n=1 Tax=Bacteroides gallinarum TaxID=376806 RepID=UPI000468CAB0
MEIIWSPVATDDFLTILRSVKDLFGNAISTKVAERIQLHVGLLSSFPRIGVRDITFSTANREVRYLVNTPNLIYYVIEQDTIYIVSICDSRQSPETIRRIISEQLSRYK